VERLVVEEHDDWPVKAPAQENAPTRRNTIQQYWQKAKASTVTKSTCTSQMIQSQRPIPVWAKCG